MVEEAGGEFRGGLGPASRVCPRGRGRAGHGSSLPSSYLPAASPCLQSLIYSAKGKVLAEGPAGAGVGCPVRSDASQPFQAPPRVSLARSFLSGGGLTWGMRGEGGEEPRGMRAGALFNPSLPVSHISKPWFLQDQPQGGGHPELHSWGFQPPQPDPASEEPVGKGSGR